jgi:hypothetical protein
MTRHPHLHMIAPGGSLANDGGRWVSCKRNFRLPARVHSKRFRVDDYDRMCFGCGNENEGQIGYLGGNTKAIFGGS